jgi:hypothetical protein
MSKNMTILDRRVRALLIAPLAVLIAVLIGPASVRLDRAVRARRGDARDQRRRLLPALLPVRDGWPAPGTAGALAPSRKE